jgi:hypothetical protein
MELSEALKERMRVLLMEISQARKKIREVECTYCHAPAGEPCVFTHTRDSETLGPAYKGQAMAAFHSARVRCSQERDANGD